MLPKMIMFTLILFLLAMLGIDYGMASFSEREINGSLKSVQGVMHYAVNKGDYRINKNLSMNEKRFLEGYQFLTERNSRSKLTAYRYSIYDVGPRHAAVSANAYSNSFVMDYFANSQDKTIKRGENMVFIWDDRRGQK